jgi:mono/diheme cytochrome c family protein
MALSKRENVFDEQVRPSCVREVGRSVVVLAFCLPVVLVGNLSFIRQGATVHASSREGREAGALVFHEKGCEHCHGVEGIGTEKGPDLSTVGKRLKKKQIERQIMEGGSGMPGFGDALPFDEVNALVDYLKAKRKAPKR